MLTIPEIRAMSNPMCKLYSYTWYNFLITPIRTYGAITGEYWKTFHKVFYPTK